MAAPSTKQTVLHLKESLSKGQDDEERCRDLLSRLDECEMTLELLQETLIGTVVSKLKHHDTLGPTAKGLVKKWKQIATLKQKPPAKPKTKPKKKTEKRPSMGEQQDSSALSADAAEAWKGLPEHRQKMCEKFHSFLVLAKPDLVKSGINAEAIDCLLGPRAAEIEAAIDAHIRDRKGYTEKARSLAFNLKKNVNLAKEVILGETPAADLVSMTSEQLASDETRQKRALEAKRLLDSARLDWNEANEDKINEMCGIRGDLLKASLFTCGRCKSVKTTSTQKQTRSADEPMTVFVLCLACGKRWRC
jgi:transcription elongation factor S-II